MLITHLPRDEILQFTILERDTIVRLYNKANGK